MLRSGVAIGDEAEAQTVPYILGIAHPTGFPAYTLTGWVFSHALPFGSVAWRLNAFAATCTALSVTGVFLLAALVADDSAVALFAALTFAFGSTVWSGALHANAQALAGTCSVFALLACVSYARKADRRVLVAACACCGVGIATHPSSIWVIPAIAVALLWQRRTVTPLAVLLAAAALILPLSLYAYLPLRSAVVAAHGLDPTSAAPLFGLGSVAWDSNAPRTPSGFLDEVLGRHENAASSLQAAFDPKSFANAAAFWMDLAQTQFPPWLLTLAALGIAALAQVDRRSLSVLAAGACGGVAFAYVYRLNAHLDRYAFVSFAIAECLLAASARLRIPRVPVSVVRTAVAVILAVGAGLAFAQNRPSAATPPFADGEAIVAAVRHDTPEGAIVVAQWNDATALAYGAFVEHVLGSRIIVAAWPGDYSERYEDWTRTRPVVAYVSPMAWQSLFPVHAHLRPLRSSLGGYHVFLVVPPKR
jgi:4-amino-4-deoxy-L-arabinose transferase-like glycosyltransferase